MRSLAEVQADFTGKLEWMTETIRPWFQHLRAEACEEAIQNTLALCWLRVAQLHANERDDVDMRNILWFSVQQHRVGRSAHRQARKLDCMDLCKPSCLDLFTSRHDSIPDTVQTSIDFAEFQRLKLSSRDREVLSDLLFSPLANNEIAAKWDLTPGRVSQLRRLIVTEYRKYVDE